MSLKAIIAILAALGVTAAISVTIYVKQQPADEGQHLQLNEKQETVVGDEQQAGFPER